MATGSRMSADERREMVLRAAFTEFAAKGLNGTSTEAIARRAGISQPYLFRLFPTKKALFLASVERCFDRVAQTFQQAAEGKAGAEAGAAMGAAYGPLLERDPDLLRHQMQAYAACGDPDVRDVTRAGFGRLWVIVERATGADPNFIRAFFSTGMLINVVAAMDLGSHDAPWAADFMPPPPQDPPRAEDVPHIPPRPEDLHRRSAS